MSKLNRLLSLSFTFLLLLGVDLASNLEVAEMCAGIVPKNNYSIPVGARLNGLAIGLDEATFNEVATRITNFYTPVFAERGWKLIVDAKWSSPTVNASAYKRGQKRYVALHGGFARVEGMTRDAFMLIACHEIGHHLGGAPRYKRMKWASVEGQSDYFGSAKCLRALFEQDSDWSLVSDIETDHALAKCDEVFEGGMEVVACARAAVAGVQLGNILARFNSAPPTSLLTPSTAVFPKKFQQSHPEAQCRTDTYFQGSICAKLPSETFANDNYRTGACTREEGFSDGVRPLCWFNPSRAQEVDARDDGLPANVNEETTEI